MEFEAYIKHATESLSSKDEVGLAMYYLSEVEGHDRMAPADVKEFLRDQPITVSSQHISAYPSQLASDGYFDPEDGEYMLTITGRSHFEDMFDLPPGEGEPREERFLDLPELEDEFYRTLIEDIEQSYTHKIYGATLILTRKLIENLLIEMLRIHYGMGPSMEKYFDTDKGHFKNFSTIIHNFEDCIGDFQPYTQAFDDEFFDELGDLRESGNGSAHSITTDVDESEIDEYSEKAENVLPLIVYVRKQIILANS